MRWIAPSFVGMTDDTQKFYLVKYHLVAVTVIGVHRLIRKLFEELVYWIRY